MMCEPPFGLIVAPRLFVPLSSKGENSPGGLIVPPIVPGNVVFMTRCVRVPSWPLPVNEAVGEPEMATPARTPGVAVAFHAHGLKCGVNVLSRWVVVSHVSTTVDAPWQVGHAAVTNVRESEFESGSCVAWGPCGIPRIGGIDALPKVPTRTVML